MRVILHIDLNNFYASVECMKHPEIKDKPVIVCGNEKKRHGVVLAKNSIAKALGIKTGMVIWEAKQLAPELITITAHFNLYKKYSKKVRKIFYEYTDYIEPYGIDESWLDITHSIKLKGSALSIATSIKDRIKNELGLTVSVGISNNKIYSKLASDIASDDSILVINDNNVKSVVYPLPVENLLYVGRATLKKLNRLNIFTIGDLASSDVSILKNHLGKWGEYLHEFANGNDLSSVKHVSYVTPLKSIGNSLTYHRDIISDSDIMGLIFVLSESVVYRAKERNINSASGISVWVRNSELESYSFQCAIAPTLTINNIANSAFTLFKKSYNYEHKVRAMGVSIFNFSTNTQRDFINPDTRQKQEKLDGAMLKIKKKYGNSAITRGVVLKDKKLTTLDIRSEHTIHPESYFRKK